MAAVFLCLHGKVDISLLSHSCSTELFKVVLGCLNRLMPQRLADDLHGFVLILHRHREAVSGRIDCQFQLALREVQLFRQFLQRVIEPFTDLLQVFIHFVRRNLQADDG